MTGTGPGPEGPDRTPEGGWSPILRYFAYSHLPQALKSISVPCAELAQEMDFFLPDGPEKSAGLRKLLEAKDAFVRAALPPAPAYPLIPKDEPATGDGT